MDSTKLFYVINEEGIRQEASILAKFKLINGINYITYTYGEINENDMIKIYSTGITGEKGNYSYKEIETTTEWDEIKNILKVLAKDEDEKLSEENESDLNIIGEEISIRKPKKLLVSSKFADTIAKKYKENVKVTVEEKEEVKEDTSYIPISDLKLDEEEVKVEEPAPIDIPTFEELQARTKKVDEVIEKDKIEAEEEMKVEEPIKVELKKEDYAAKFKSEVEPVLLDVYSKQQAQIDALEEELSKTKYDLFEKQKEALSLKKDNEELTKKGTELEEELSQAKAKVDGIMEVLNGNK